MSSKIAFNSDFYTIEINIEANLLQSRWHRAVSEQEIITGTTKLYEALRDTKIERAVANAQSLGTLTPAAKDWLANDFYRLLSQTQLKKLARVMPASVFHQLALESVVTRAEAMGKTNYQVKSFSNQQAALDWLQV